MKIQKIKSKISEDIKLAVEEFKKLKVGQAIKNPNRTIRVLKLTNQISRVIKAKTPDVLISRKTLKHILERRQQRGKEFIDAMPDILTNPSKIADNSKKTSNSFLFVKMNGKAKGVVLEVKKTPEGNRVVSAFPIDKKTYEKIVDISGRAEFPSFELAKGKNYQQILSDVRKSTGLNISKKDKKINENNGNTNNANKT